MKGPPLTDVNSLAVIVMGGEDHTDYPTERKKRPPHGNVASTPPPISISRTRVANGASWEISQSRTIP